MRYLKNRLYMIFVSLSAILAYGYQITHCSIGVDDTCIDHYFVDGFGLTNGRWPFFVLNTWFGVAGIDKVVPYAADLLAVILMVLAAVIWCEFIARICDRKSLKIGTFPYIVFSAFMITYSLIAQVWVYYLHNGTAIGYVLVGISLIIFTMSRDDMSRQNGFIRVLTVIVLLCVACSFYESILTLFCLGYGIYLGLTYYHEKRIDYRKLILGFLSLLVVLICAMGLRSFIDAALCVIHGAPWGARQPGADHLMAFVVELKEITAGTICTYFMLPEYQPIRLFMLCIFFDLIVVVADIIRHKRIRMLFIGIYCLASIFAITLLNGHVLPYRTMQSLSVFVGFSLMLFAHFMCGKLVNERRNVALGIIPYLILGVVFWNNICEINYSFFMEYSNYEYNMTKVDHIGYGLYELGYTPDENDVVFVSAGGDGSSMPYPLESDAIIEGSIGDTVRDVVCRVLEVENPVSGTGYYQNITNNVLTWGLDAFFDQKQMKRMLERAGYEINTYEGDIDRSLISQMPAYPQDGYICKTDDCYIVRID